MIGHSFFIVYGQTILSRRLTTLASEYLTRTSKADTFVKLIKNHTVISSKHLTPEIQLYLVTPECKLWSCDASSSVFEDPFWAFYWPGGQVVSRYILDNPSVIRNKSVLDIGCGSGACSIAASLAGGKQVVANDIDAVACIATSMNAILNSVNIEVSSKDLIGEDIPWDCVLLGDMFYDSEFASKLVSWLRQLCAKNKTILIGDPGRWAFENEHLHKHLKLLAEYQLPQNVIIENNGFLRASVWKFIN